MNNAHSINVATLGQPASLIQDAVVDVLRNVLFTDGVVEAADDEPAERTVIVVHFTESPWITVYDDGSFDDINHLCTNLSSRLGSPVTLLLVHDSNVLSLSLLRHGECLDELRSELFEVESKMIPELFIGKAVDVKRQWSKVLKKLFDTRNWDEALAGEPHVAIDEIGLYLHTTPPIPFDDDPLPRVQLYLAMHRFTEMAYDRFTGAEQARIPLELMLEGMARPWFCMACVATQFSIPVRERRDILVALKRVLRCWPDLIRWSEQLDGAYSEAAKATGREPWWSIYIHVLRMCEALGHDWEKEVEPWRHRDPDDVAMQIAKWVSEATKTAE